MEGRMTAYEIKARYGNKVFSKAVMMSPESEDEVVYEGALYRIIRDVVMWVYHIRRIGDAPVV